MNLLRQPSLCHENGLIGNWLWAAVLYVSYNLVLAISVLGPLGVQAKNKNAIRNGAILGGIGLGVSATAIYFAMERNFEIVRDMEIPMIYLAGSLSIYCRLYMHWCLSVKYILRLLEACTDFRPESPT